MKKNGKAAIKTAILLNVIVVTILTGCGWHKKPVKVHYPILDEKQISTLSASSLKSLRSISVIDSLHLFAMNYYGDYAFKEYLYKGSKNDMELFDFLESQYLYPNERIISDDNDDKFGCTCFSTVNAQKNVLFGRNFDWMDQPAMLLYTDPKDGYASVSMVDAYYLGYDFSNMRNDYHLNGALLSAPYFPLDGMNERGLAVGVMSLSHSEPTQDKNKKTISSLAAVRLVLDYAANVNEALELIKHYNVYFNQDVPVHLLISDKNGNSAVIEFLQGNVEITKSPNNWQVSTNFILKESEKERSGYNRYVMAEDQLVSNKGNLSRAKIMSLLRSVSQEETQWSVVYDLSGLEYDVCTRGNYNMIKSFKLGELNR